MIETAIEPFPSILEPDEEELVKRGQDLKTEADLKELSGYLEEIGEKIASKLERAKRYKEQGERRASPLEASAKYLLDCIRPLLIKYAEARLPKYQSGKNIGKYSSKTLDLETARFSFKKASGAVIYNDDRALSWLQENSKSYPELSKFIETKTTITKPELTAFLKNWKNQEDILGFMSNCDDNEFAEVKCVID